jgi:hypothetical protein
MITHETPRAPKKTVKTYTRQSKYTDFFYIPSEANGYVARNGTVPVTGYVAMLRHSCLSAKLLSALAGYITTGSLQHLAREYCGRGVKLPAFLAIDTRWR